MDKIEHSCEKLRNLKVVFGETGESLMIMENDFRLFSQFIADLEPFDSFSPEIKLNEKIVSLKALTFI